MNSTVILRAYWSGVFTSSRNALGVNMPMVMALKEGAVVSERSLIEKLDGSGQLFMEDVLGRDQRRFDPAAHL
jgi:hypothetical protein